MAIEEDDTESCSSRPFPLPILNDNDNSSPKSKINHQTIKLQVFQEVLDRLQHSCSNQLLPVFEDQLWCHFNRLPAGYALDVNVERAQDVLTHINLLQQAQAQAQQHHHHFLAFHVRIVQVNSNPNGLMCDTVHSRYSKDEGTQDSVKNSVGLGLLLGSHPPPAFGSSQNLDTVGINSNLEDRDSFADHHTSSSVRAMHEVTFSTIDKPKLLSQLTSLLSDLGLNIQEAHAFSTVDGFSLDVFVVEGWPHEETEELRSLLEKEIQNMKPQPQDLSPASAGIHQQADSLDRNVKEENGDNFVDIDRSLLKIEGKVASGSHGDLYKGAYCGQEVAIKILKPERVSTDAVKEFFQEVNIMRRLQHKNIVQLIGACTKSPNLFLVTEFMPRGNLYDFMHKRKGVFTFQSLLKAASDISSGMEYLHQNNILHRDLKTANLLMGVDGVIKVADFGVARIQMQPGVMTAETGTYRWMAPEVISHNPYDHKADVFSFGIVLWELLTGELPYSHLSPLQAAIGVVQKGLRPVIPNHTHPKLADLLNRCWHQEPNLRPEFSDIISILQAISTEVGISEIKSSVVKEEPGTF